jgi:hypothetical protein
VSLRSLSSPDICRGVSKRPGISRRRFRAPIFDQAKGNRPKAKGAGGTSERRCDEPKAQKIDIAGISMP